MDTDGETRSRRGSVSSTRRRRDEESEAAGGSYVTIRRELEDYLSKKSKKVNKLPARQVLGLFARLEEDNIKLRVTVAR